MSPDLTPRDVVDALGRVAEALPAQVEALNAADRALGDGDLGITVREAFRRLSEEVREVPSEMEIVLLACAKALSSWSGSSYGTLLAAGFMASASCVKGLATLPWNQLAEVLAAVRDKMAQRGRSGLGDKTVLDAVEAARLGAERASSPEALQRSVLDAIDETLTRLRPEPCRQGRARIFADKSRGLDDPGMLGFRAVVAAL